MTTKSSVVSPPVEDCFSGEGGFRLSTFHVLFLFACRHGMSASASETQTGMGWRTVRNWETPTASGKRGKYRMEIAPVTLVGFSDPGPSSVHQLCLTDCVYILHACVCVCVRVRVCMVFMPKYIYKRYIIFHRYLWTPGWSSLYDQEWLGLVYSSGVWMPTARDNTW